MKNRSQSVRKRNHRCMVAVSVLLIGALLWGAVRLTAHLPTPTGEARPLPYTQEEAALKAIALSYLVYGCESLDAPSGSVQQLLATETMGIVAENHGICRTQPDDPATALWDSKTYIANQVGQYELLLSRKDHASSFYGAAFCDRQQRCVWVVYAGSNSLRDLLACAQLLTAPGLSAQEKQAFALYEAVQQTEPVQQEGYAVVLSGHSLGGALATLVACTATCPAVTVNGADGIALARYRALGGEQAPQGLVHNHLTAPLQHRFSVSELTQRGMFWGDLSTLDTYVYPHNGDTYDTHNPFSFLTFADDARTRPTLPQPQ